MVKADEKTRRIARNSIMLYARLLITTVVALYTSRVVIATLGQTDYGIFDLVAGIVILLAFVNIAMATATQRFLTFELGRGEEGDPSTVFSSAVKAHMIVAAILILLSETVGLWFINTQLAIPAERMTAANWVYQAAVVRGCINIIRVPYDASVVASERMGFYAFLGIAEAALRLFVVLLLVFMGGDKLILYSILLVGVTLVIYIIYMTYCRRHFVHCRFRSVSDGKLMRRMLGFSGWSLAGSAANVGAQQGISVILNLFWGVTVNAALGVANQLSNAVYAFVSNFQVAFNPQIVKSYAAGDSHYFRSLIYRTSRFSYYLMLVISLPVILQTDYLLDLWLTEVPEYSAAFGRLIMVFFLIDALSAPLWMAVQATGNIRIYQILMSILILLNIPVAYLVIRAGYPPYYAIGVRVAINFAAFLFRIIYMRRFREFSVSGYLREAVLPVVIVSVLSFPLPYYVSTVTAGFGGFAVTVSVTVVWVILVCLYAGMKSVERRYLIESGWKLIRRKHY